MTLDKKLPTFIIGGAPRSGTTFLCHVLDKHPDVFIAKPFSPEPKICLQPAAQGLTEYKKRYEELFAPVTHQKAWGEKSSAYLENINALNHLKNVITKQTRFLFIVREPVKRAYSNYLRSKNNGLETLSFSEAIKLEGQRQDPFPPEKSYVRPFDYLIRGDYATYAERYLNAFGRDRVKFILFENIQHAPDAFYKDLQTFIQVDPLPREKIATGKINASEPDETLDENLANELREKMRPSVERFSQLTNLDVSVWGY